MSDLVILRYTKEAPLDSVYEAVVAIPYSIDILEDCSLEQLYEVKNIIDNAIKEME